MGCIFIYDSKFTSATSLLCGERHFHLIKLREHYSRRTTDSGHMTNDVDSRVLAETMTTMMELG